MLSLNVLLLIPPTGPWRISRISAGNKERAGARARWCFSKWIFVCFAYLCISIPSNCCFADSYSENPTVFSIMLNAGKNGWGLLALQMTLRRRIHFPTCLLHKGEVRISLLHKDNTSRGIMSDLYMIFPRIVFILLISFS